MPVPQPSVSLPGPAFLRRGEVSLPRLAAALGLALVAHLLLVGATAALSWLGWLAGAPLPKREENVSLVTMSDARWNANRAVQGERPAPAVPEPKRAVAEPVKRESMPHGQVVDVAAGNDQRPDNAAYLAEHDNKVDRQTRSRDAAALNARPAPMRTSALPAAESRPQPGGPAGKRGNGGTAEAEAAPHEGSHTAHQELPSVKPRQELAVASTEPNGEIHNQSEEKKNAGNSPRLWLAPGELAKLDDDASASLGRAGAPGEEAAPSKGEAAQESGAPSNDRLDLPEGAGTWLNTREFRYAQFFNRIKQRVSEQWSVETALRRQGRRATLGGEERTTLLMVALDTDGRIVEVNVARSSGVTALDEEAVAAFQRAQPFPNPPRALFDDAGQMRFMFGFYVEPREQGSAFRVFRSRD